MLQDIAVKCVRHLNIVGECNIANRDTTLIFTLPYDKGWSAKQNGKSIQIHRIQKGLMGVHVPKGSGTVTLTFIPQGLVEGGISFFVGIILFFLYEWRQIKRRKS